MTTVQQTTDSRRFEPGELVTIRIDRVRYVGRDHDSGNYTVETTNGQQWRMPWAAVIERVAPKEWPPQPADSWVDRRDVEWCAVNVRQLAVQLVDTTDGNRSNADWVNENYGPLRLVRRRGWTPDAPATVDEPVMSDRAADAIVDLIVGDAEMRGYSPAGDAS